MSVPKLTIPEAAYSPDAFQSLTTVQRRTSLFQFLLRLTNGSAAVLVAAYIVGLVALKPLMATTASRRLQYIEHFRHKIRDFYLDIISRVNHVPIVGIQREKGVGKVYAEAVCQTDLSRDKDLQGNDVDNIGTGSIHEKLESLHNVLSRCSSFSLSDMPHYRSTDYAIKDFQQKTDMVYFSHKELFSETTQGADNKPRVRNLSQEAKNEIRGIKGLYMSGQV